MFSQPQTKKYLNTKVGLFITLIFIALTMISFILYDLPKNRQQLASSYQQSAIFLVENALSILHFYYQRQQDGRLSLAEAQEEALAVIASLNFDDEGYFFLGDDQGYALANGNPDLVGTNILHLESASGRLVVKEIYDKAVSGGGFVEYHWPRLDGQGYEHKTSYVVQFEPWSWTLGTGINTTHLQQSLNQARQHSIMGGAAIFFLLSLVLVAAYLLNRYLSTFRSRLSEAREDNPLTLLPGNQRIRAQLQSQLQAQQNFVFIYIDLDQFKAFNDAYGYALGDQVLVTLASILKKAFTKTKCFVGHIGGDDFVVISNQKDWLKAINQTCVAFEKQCHALYSQEDQDRGGIYALDRFGVERFFPLVSLSVSCLDIESRADASLSQLADEMTQLKLQAKNTQGSCLLYKPLQGEVSYQQLPTPKPQPSAA